MKAAIGILAGGLALCFAFIVQAQTLPARIKASSRVVVANQPNYPPLEYRDTATNELKGLDIDLQTALAGQLGLTVQWSSVGYEQMVSSLVTGRVDLIHSGMSDIPSRRDHLDFVDYMKTGAQFYTLAAFGRQIRSPEDLCGKKVGMSRRTSFPDETARWSQANCVAKGRPMIIIVGTEGSSDARAQLKQGRLSGAVQGSETLPYLMSMEKGAYAAIGAPFTVQYQGIAFPKASPQLRDAYAVALTRLIASGRYRKILDSYGLGFTALDKVMINSQPVK